MCATGHGHHSLLSNPAAGGDLEAILHPVNPLGRAPCHSATLKLRSIHERDRDTACDVSVALTSFDKSSILGAGK